MAYPARLLRWDWYHLRSPPPCIDILSNRGQAICGMGSERLSKICASLGGCPWEPKMIADNRNESHRAKRIGILEGIRRPKKPLSKLPLQRKSGPSRAPRRTRRMQTDESNSFTSQTFAGRTAHSTGRVRLVCSSVGNLTCRYFCVTFET